MEARGPQNQPDAEREKMYAFVYSALKLSINIDGTRRALLDDISPAPGDRVWGDGDHDSMLRIVELGHRWQPFTVLEYDGASISRRTVLPIEAGRTGVRLARTMMRYQAALPYTIGEQALLLDLYRDEGMCSASDGTDYDDYVEAQFAGVNTAIMNGGRREMVHGPELMDRWSAWRRQTGQFAGQNSLGVAVEALSEAHLMVRRMTGHDVDS